MSVQQYFAPETVQETLELMAAHGDAALVAGGTDLVVGTRRGIERLEGTLIALHRLDELRGIEVRPDGALHIGGLATHGDVEHTPEVVRGWTALADASALVGSPATRNFGTVGGNLINASPAMELGSPLLVCDATVELQSEKGRRTLRVDELVTGPRRTTARADELLTAVTVPALAAGTGTAYVRLQYRRAMEIAVVGAAALVRLERGEITAARLALTAVAPTCVLVPAAEAALVGRRLDSTLLEEAAATAAAVAAPITDVRASRDYRAAMVRVIALRALTAAARRAAGDAVPVPASNDDSTPRL